MDLNPIKLITGAADSVTNALGLGSVSDFLGMLTGKTGMDMSESMFNTSLQWEKEKFDREIELANTAHQRELEDLKAAGLNPIAFGNKGASVPSVGGVSPLNMNGAGQGLRDLIFSGIGSVMDMKMMGEQMKQIKAQTNYIETQNALEAAKLAAFQNQYNLGGGKLGNYFDMLIEQQLTNLAISNKQLGFLENYGDVEHILQLIKTGTGSISDIAGILKPVIGGKGSTVLDLDEIQKVGNEWYNTTTGEKITYKKRYRN